MGQGAQAIRQSLFFHFPASEPEVTCSLLSRTALWSIECLPCQTRNLVMVIAQGGRAERLGSKASFPHPPLFECPMPSSASRLCPHQHGPASLFLQNPMALSRPAPRSHDCRRRKQLCVEAPLLKAFWSTSELFLRQAALLKRVSY